MFSIIQSCFSLSLDGIIINYLRDVKNNYEDLKQNRIQEEIEEQQFNKYMLIRHTDINIDNGFRFLE